MNASNVVSLEVASRVDAEALSELLEHYVGELSTLFAKDRVGVALATVVRVSQANVAALPFWRNTVQSYTGGAFSVGERPGQRGSWHVFSFRSAGDQPQDS